MRLMYVCGLMVGLSPAWAAEPVETFLFNGKDLSGWVIDGPKEFKDKATNEMKPIWSVKDGVIVCAGGAFGFLRHEKEYDDFVFTVEYRFPPRDPKVKREHGNSGLGVRTVVFDPKKSLETRPSFAAYEIQLLDDAGKPPTKHSTASLYRYVAPSKLPVKASPEWNTISIQCIGTQIAITLNDEKILEHDQTSLKETANKPLKGYVCLQCHGSPVEFRVVKIREIKK